MELPKTGKLIIFPFQVPIKLPFRSIDIGDNYYYKHPADSVCLCVSNAVTSCHKDVTNGKP